MFVSPERATEFVREGELKIRRLLGCLDLVSGDTKPMSELRRYFFDLEILINHEMDKDKEDDENPEE